MKNDLTKYVSDWFVRGDDDLALVQLILEKRTASANLACFHAQQAAEKYLKGFLAYYDLHVRKIHDLEILLEDCKTVDQSSSQLQDDVSFLNRFYAESRYPDDYVECSRQDAEAAYAAALRIKEFVLSKAMPLETNGGFGLVGIIIALAVVVFAAGGGLYWKETRNQKLVLQSDNDATKQAEELKEKIEGHNKEAENESAADTLTWKTYRNEWYGLEFKYPSDWKIIESGPSPTGFQYNVVGFFEKSRLEGKTEEELAETVTHSPDFEIYLINGRPMALDQDWVHYKFGSYELTGRKKLLGGKDWTIIKCVAPPPCGSEEMAVYLPEAQTIGVSLNREDVLSTLKFIK